MAFIISDFFSTEEANFPVRKRSKNKKKTKLKKNPKI